MIYLGTKTEIKLEKSLTATDLAKSLEDGEIRPQRIENRKQIVEKIVRKTTAVPKLVQIRLWGLLLCMQMDISLPPLHCMQRGFGDRKTVRLFVCPSVKRVNCDNTKESYAHILISMKGDASSFVTRRMVGGDIPFYLKFWAEQTHPLPSKTPIFNIFSLVAPQP